MNADQAGELTEKLNSAAQDHAKVTKVTVNPDTQHPERSLFEMELSNGLTVYGCLGNLVRLEGLLGNTPYQDEPY